MWFKSKPSPDPLRDHYKLVLVLHGGPGGFCGICNDYPAWTDSNCAAWWEAKKALLHPHIPLQPPKFSIMAT